MATATPGLLTSTTRMAMPTLTGAFAPALVISVIVEVYEPLHRATRPKEPYSFPLRVKTQAEKGI